MRICNHSRPGPNPISTEEKEKKHHVVHFCRHMCDVFYPASGENDRDQDFTRESCYFQSFRVQFGRSTARHTNFVRVRPCCLSPLLSSGSSSPSTCDFSSRMIYITRPLFVQKIAFPRSPLSSALLSPTLFPSTHTTTTKKHLVALDLSLSFQDTCQPRVRTACHG